MSKTHWLAIAQVLLTAAQATGALPPGVSEFAQYVLGIALTGTVGHRMTKLVSSNARR